VPEEIVEVPDAVDVEVDVLSQERFYFRFVVQAACFHGQQYIVRRDESQSRIKSVAMTGPAGLP
jgi:hypothetical protein